MAPRPATATRVIGISGPSTQRELPNLALTRPRCRPQARLCPASNSDLTAPGRQDKCPTQQGRSQMFKRISGAVCGMLFAVTSTALAQTYPAKPMTMIIPFAAGGPTDVLGRVMAQRMSEILGQQVVVENVGGAGGMTGSKGVD